MQSKRLRIKENYNYLELNFVIFTNYLENIFYFGNGSLKIHVQQTH
jgi:hypothetical protein